ncbi:hypothetical protein ACWDE0_36520 [Streptomyces sp. 900105755]
MCATWENGAVPPYGPRPSSAASGPTRRAELDRLLEFAVRDTGVLAGAVFPLASDGQTLRLGVTTGLPTEYLTPWSRVALSSPVAVAEALRLRRLVRLSDPDEFARRYPRTATALRHHCAAAAAPIVSVPASAAIPGRAWSRWGRPRPRWKGWPAVSPRNCVRTESRST